MSLLDTKTKQPLERLDYDIYYDDFLTIGDGISQKNTDVTVSGTGLVCPFFIVTGSVVKVWLEGGDSGTTYLVTVTVTTDDGRRKQDEFKVKVKEI